MTSKQKTEAAEEPKPVSPLYEVQGRQCRQYSDGWYCTCGGVPGDECEHIPVAKVMHKEAKAAAKEEKAE